MRAAPFLVGICALLSGAGAIWASYHAQPYMIISHQGKTLRLQWEDQIQRRRIFPVGIGRVLTRGRLKPLGTFATGADPHDTRFYLPARRDPPFYGGLPFLRLRHAGAYFGGGTNHRASPPVRRRQLASHDIFAIHGPVTPTLIWGTISAGCVRMRSEDLRHLFQVAMLYPSMPVTFIPDLDRVAGQPVQIDQRPMTADTSCPEAATGIRALQRLVPGQDVVQSLCQGIDHWFAMELKGGDQLAVRLHSRGMLQMELYGPRALSTIASGRDHLLFNVPRVHRNRGDRYLRILVAEERPATDRSTSEELIIPYRLLAALGGQ